MTVDANGLLKRRPDWFRFCHDARKSPTEKPKKGAWSGLLLHPAHPRVTLATPGNEGRSVVSSLTAPSAAPTPDVQSNLFDQVRSIPGRAARSGRRRTRSEHARGGYDGCDRLFDNQLQRWARPN